VLPSTDDPTYLNTAQTAQLLPCQFQSLDTQVLVTSAPGGPTVYPRISVRLYKLGGSPISTSGTSPTDQVVVDLAPLAPGAATVADVTAISSVSPLADILFQPSDLPRRRAFRMEISVAPFADPQHNQLVPDADPGNDVINFWLKRAC
jgi:hypothetical protein